MNLKSIWRLSIAGASVVTGLNSLWQDESKGRVLVRRYVRRNAYPGRARWQWFLLLIVQLVLWYAAVSWVLIARVMLARRKVSDLPDLVHLALGFGVNPAEYYLMHLYRWRKDAWLDFVFPQEESCWHSVLSTQGARQSVDILRDKHRFAETLGGSGLSVIETRQFLVRSSCVSVSEVLGESDSVFLKPNHGFALRGCMELTRSKSGVTLRTLLSDSQPGLSTIKDIESKVQSCVDQSDYLVQKVLCNHEKVTLLFGADELVTMRVVSIISEDKLTFVYPLMEVPDTSGGWEAWKIDPSSWMVFESGHHEGNDFPCSTEAKSLLEKAHRIFPDVLTIAWDVAITQNGPCIIEGNCGWGLSPVQTVLEIPALQTPLLDAYLAVVEANLR